MSQSKYDPTSPEAVFHKTIKGHLTKRQQGLVMGAFREAMAKVQSTALAGSQQGAVERHSCSCTVKCAQGDLATDEVTIDCKRSC